MATRISDDHVITRHGKRYALYAGLLDAFHNLEDYDPKTFDRQIDTELIQAPTDQNGMVAICKASARIVDLDDGEVYFGPFEGIGDASPENVGRNIAPHIIRQAETRAKARALRDAINASEMVSDDVPTDDPSEAPRTASKGRGEDAYRQPQPPPTEYRGEESGATAKRGGALKPDDPAPEQLKKRLRTLIADDEGWADVQEWEESHSLINTMTVSQVSKALRSLTKNR